MAPLNYGALLVAKLAFRSMLVEWVCSEGGANEEAAYCEWIGPYFGASARGLCGAAFTNLHNFATKPSL